MSVSANLSFRIAAVLIGGFVLLQLVVGTVMLLPSEVYQRRASNLPPPDQVRAMAATLENIQPELRPAALAAFDDSLFQVRVVAELPRVEREQSGRLSEQRRAYLAALSDRPVLLWRHEAIIHRPLRDQPGPQNYIDPTQLAVGLRDGRWLLIDSRPSLLLQAFLRRRAFLTFGFGTVALLALWLAVRQTTRPLVRLSHRIRTFALELDAPDLPVTGAQELRELSAAFNEMKARIRGLVEERTRLLAAIAHDMRTYLTRLRLRAEFIDDESHRARAVSDLAEMHDLLEDTLLFAQQASSREAKLSSIDLSEVLARIVETRVEMGENVRLDPTEQDLVVRAAPLGLRRILANLIDNGLRYAHNVQLRAEQTADGIVLIVEDDGPGVPPEALATLGEPFNRIDPSRDRSTGGAGLGLAIVQALAERSRIGVRFENKAPTGFRVTLIFGLPDGTEAG